MKKARHSKRSAPKTPRRNPKRLPTRGHSGSEASPIPSPPPAPVLSGPRPFGFFLLAGIGSLLFIAGWNWTGFVVFLGSVGMALGMRKVEMPRGSAWAVLGWLAGFLLIAYGLLDEPSQAPFRMSSIPFRPVSSDVDIYLGILLLVGGFAWGRSDPARRGLGSFSTFFWLTLILGASAWIRLAHTTDPPAFYWMDYALSMIDGRQALDISTERPLIFNPGSRQPLYQYLVAAAYYFFPTTPGYVIQNFLWAFIDLTAVWVHYLLGKEVGGRRTGLILAALMGLSKPLLVNCMTGQSPITGPLGVGVILLFTFRFIRKTDAKHALQWGAAVAFGAYCYTTVRMYMWIGPMAVLSVAIWRARAGREWGSWILGLGTGLAWTYLYFLTNKFIKPLSETLHLPAANGILVIAFVFLLVLAFKARKRAFSDPAHGLSNVFLGFLAAGALAAPIALHPLFSEWSFRWSIFWPQHPLLPADGLSMRFILSQFQKVFFSFFQNMMDRGDMSLTGESFLNLQAIVLAAVGLAYAVCRIKPLTAFLLASTALCAVPHAFSFLGHTGRLLGMVTPLFLLSALGADEFLGILRRFRRGFFWTALGVALLSLFGFWALKDMEYRFYVLLPKYAGNNYVIFKQVRQDAPKYRVYLIQEGTTVSYFDQTPLVDHCCDLHTMLLVKGSSPVPVFAGKETPDVAVYFSSKYPEIHRRIREEFPNVRFEDLHASYDAPDAALPFMYRAYIPGKDIQALRMKDNPRMFYKVDVPERAWRRRFYMSHYGLGQGVIEAEDWVSDPLTPVPIQDAVRPVEITGTVRLPRDGRYKFSVEAWNFAVVKVGKHQVLNHRISGTKLYTTTGARFFKAGDYPVQFRTYFQVGFDVPKVLVVFPGETEERPLGSLSI